MCFWVIYSTACHIQLEHFSLPGNASECGLGLLQHIVKEQALQGILGKRRGRRSQGNHSQRLSGKNSHFRTCSFLKSSLEVRELKGCRCITEETAQPFPTYFAHITRKNRIHIEIHIIDDYKSNIHTVSICIHTYIVLYNDYITF